MFRLATLLKPLQAAPAANTDGAVVPAGLDPLPRSGANLDRTLLPSSDPRLVAGPLAGNEAAGPLAGWVAGAGFVVNSRSPLAGWERACEPGAD